MLPTAIIKVAVEGSMLCITKASNRFSFMKFARKAQKMRIRLPGRLQHKSRLASDVRR